MQRGAASLFSLSKHVELWWPPVFVPPFTLMYVKNLGETPSKLLTKKLLVLLLLCGLLLGGILSFVGVQCHFSIQRQRLFVCSWQPQKMMLFVEGRPTNVSINVSLYN